MSSCRSTYNDVLKAPSQPKRPGTPPTSSHWATLERPRPQPRESQKFSKNGERQAPLLGREQKRSDLVTLQPAVSEARLRQPRHRVAPSCVHRS